MQGVGWLTLEELRWDETDGPGRGRLLTQSASTYKLPSFSEMPEEFNVRLLEHAADDGVVYGTKAVGEPPLMLAFTVREAIRDAVAAFGPARHVVELGSPATAETTYRAIHGGARRARGLGGCRQAVLPPCALIPTDSVKRGVSNVDWVAGRAATSARHGRRAVIVTLAMVRGHAPRNGGAKMVVSLDRCVGTVGGGNLEATAIHRAREMLADGAAEPRAAHASR